MVAAVAVPVNGISPTMTRIWMLIRKSNSQQEPCHRYRHRWEVNSQKSDHVLLNTWFWWITIFYTGAANAAEATTADEQGGTDDAGDEREVKKDDATTMDFAANIEKVKEVRFITILFSNSIAINRLWCICVQYGWYWGPISSEAAEKILSNEPDGSFIVRDSSDDHYIFSLTFKLNNCVRHVRIEQDQGTFSFGSCAKFKSRTIMEFIENAVESSRSGR